MNDGHASGLSGGFGRGVVYTLATVKVCTVGGRRLVVAMGARSFTIDTVNVVGQNR
jgi:hypothetical protein